jgi:hypothetical protein
LNHASHKNKDIKNHLGTPPGSAGGLTAFESHRKTKRPPKS